MRDFALGNLYDQLTSLEADLINDEEASSSFIVLPNKEDRDSNTALPRTSAMPSTPSNMALPRTLAILSTPSTSMVFQ